MTALKPLACVIGDMDLVRPLGLAGIPCAVVARPGDPTRYSRFTRAAIDWADAWTQSEVLLERLLAFGRARAEKPVLFYEEDRDLLLISRHRDRLQEAFRFVVGDPGLVEDLVDKARFQALAERLDLPVPASVRVSPSRGTGPEDVDLPFPLIVKPIARRTEKWSLVAGDGKAVQVDTPERLRALWPAMREAGLEFLAQQVVPGPESAIESYHCYVDASANVRAEFTGKKIRTYPIEYGLSTALAITRQPDVLELGRELVRRTGLTGVAKLDFKRAPDGRLYLLEVNPRFNLWHHPAAAAGVNLPALVYGDLTGFPVPMPETPRAGVCWSCPWHDLFAARKSGISLPDWLLWTARCEAKSAMAWDDPLPFLRGVLRRRLSRAFGRLFRSAAPQQKQAALSPIRSRSGV